MKNFKLGLASDNPAHTHFNANPSKVLQQPANYNKVDDGQKPYFSISEFYLEFSGFFNCNAILITIASLLPCATSLSKRPFPSTNRIYCCKTYSCTH
jgi:hypothetical protein